MTMRQPFGVVEAVALRVDGARLPIERVDEAVAHVVLRNRVDRRELITKSEVVGDRASE